MLRSVVFICGVGTVTLLCSVLTMLTHFVDPGDRMFAAILRFLSWSWVRLAGVDLRVESAVPLDELFARPVFLAGNHQSSLDIPILGGIARGQIRYFAKRELFWVPVMGWAMTLKGFTPIHRGNPHKTRPALDRALARLMRGPASFVVFPEGTRSRDGSVLPYRRGAFNLAKKAGIRVVPFAIEGTGRSMPKGAWSAKPGIVVVRLGPPIETADLPDRALDDLMLRARKFTEEALSDMRNRALQ